MIDIMYPNQIILQPLLAFILLLALWWSKHGGLYTGRDLQLRQTSQGPLIYNRVRPAIQPAACWSFHPWSVGFVFCGWATLVLELTCLFPRGTGGWTNLGRGGRAQPQPIYSRLSAFRLVSCS